MCRRNFYARRGSEARDVDPPYLDSVIVARARETELRWVERKRADSVEVTRESVSPQEGERENAL